MYAIRTQMQADSEGEKYALQPEDYFLIKELFTGFYQMDAYRIFEMKDGRLKTLFHGIDGSRVVEPGRWYEAWVHMVSDGGRPYRSGFHVFREYETSLRYLDRFHADRLLVVRPVIVEDTWRKATNHEVILARWMMVPEIRGVRGCRNVRKRR